MKRYEQISLSLGTVFALAAMGCVWWVSQHASPALDGNGPNPVLVLLLLLAWVAGAALLVSTVVSLVVLVRRRSPEAMRAAGWNGMLFVLVVATTIGRPLLDSLEGFASHFSHELLASTKANEAIWKGSVEDFEKYLAKAQAHEPADSYAYTIESTAAWGARLDIMKIMKSKGFAFAVPGREDDWADLVRMAVSSMHVTPEARVQAVTWLLDEGTASGFSLSGYSSYFSEPSLYATTYQDLSDPVTQKLLDALIAHGANVAACRGDGEACPLWQMAHDGNADAVRYLIAHGAQVNSKNFNAERTAALTEAIDRRNPVMVKMLLDAGATVSLQDYHNDVLKACESWLYNKTRDTEEVLDLLRAAHLRIAADSQEVKYQLQNAGMAECLRGFM